MKTWIYEKAVENAMSWTSRGNVVVQLTDTKWGVKYGQWESLISADLREDKFSTPRCQRMRKWDVESRLSQLTSISR